ncbi:MAG: 5'/3'-nucleotidase SurE [Sedimentisphaerales bacterium]|nr:5'/3'-nucleotidase SurE [Sedimentisphaerales bacterium]
MILLTNDDGIFAQGLAALYRRLTQLGRVTVVAPIDCRSGTSHSITFNQPLVCNKVSIEGLFAGYGVHGSPADCVKLAAMQLHDGPIDLVVSGINHGANVGINVYYSGTVAAAIEGAFMRIPAVAISLAAGDCMDFDLAAEHAIRVLKMLLPIDPGEVINVNLPHLSKGSPKGIAVVPQSTNGFEESYVCDPDSQDGRFLLSCGQHRPDEFETDTMMLSQGYITITPLQPDMTNHRRLAHLRQVLGHPVVWA